MFPRLLTALAPLLFLASAQAAAPAPAVSPQDLMRHVQVLASDAFEGRKPGTAGETKTLAYLAQQMAALGLQPAGEEGGWYQKVGLVTRRPFAHRALWSADGQPIDFIQTNAVFIGRNPVERIADAPVYFVGHGAVIPDRQIDQLAGVDLKGAVALLLFDPPNVPGFPDYAERVRAVTEAGAAAVIGIVGDEIPWSAITASYAAGQNKLEGEPVPPIQGAIPVADAARLVSDSGGNFEKLLGEPGPSFQAVRLKPKATLEVSTRVHAYTSHNVIGRLRGSGDGKEHLLYLAHWDHLGVCKPDGADRICNGAVDNASGLAVMLEVARRLARGPRLGRDVLFMGTTAEELGLLGAEHFARQPTVPLKSIVAAINIDTVAIAPRGMPVAIIGRGATPLDPLIDETARALGRGVDSDLEGNAFIQRQDGWAFTRAGVPAVMIGGSFSDMGKLGAFLSGPYHKAEDDLQRPIDLGGAAEDAELMVAVGRKLADPKAYPAPAR
jgi:Zn-dependent M28 family amino/carboxypeptidase